VESLLAQRRDRDLETERLGEGINYNYTLKSGLWWGDVIMR